MKYLILLIAAPLLAQVPVKWNGHSSVTVAQKQTVCSDPMMASDTTKIWFQILGSAPGPDSGLVVVTNSGSPLVLPFSLSSTPSIQWGWTLIPAGKPIKICLYGDSLPNGPAVFDSGSVRVMRGDE